MLWLNRPRLSICTIPANKIVVSWPGTPGYGYTLLRTTNLHGLWTLAPGWTSNRTGVSGAMSYTNTQAQASENYLLQMDYKFLSPEPGAR
jgi:hypothetical protein